MVDDDAFVLAGIRLMLSEQGDLEIVGTASDGREAINQIRHVAPDIVLMDLRMPGMNGIEATRAIKQDPRPPRVLALTTWDTDNMIRDALAAGADGFLLKDASPQELSSAIRRAYSGEPALAPAVTRKLVAAFTQGIEARQESLDALSLLSEMETEVALAIAQGLSNAAIANQQYMSVGNVKACVSRILTKLGLTNRVQIATLIQRGQPGRSPEA
ncbi:response regulator transcription factor [Brevibacterium sp. SMBL_HHYL_HB1]|uniref:response regulator transcription factor n=1 Tax=Brevibacterium sp. SMBL_HHYL_HB1 TaxID=2777556 RepID=UPI0020127A47|nr:response regulator transcription factor [Brevibacterium sp. SMBL_HHYL_HB1]